MHKKHINISVSRASYYLHIQSGSRLTKSMYVNQILHYVELTLVLQEKMIKLRDLASLSLTTFAASGTRLSIPTSSHGSEAAMALSLGATTRTIARSNPEAGVPSPTSTPPNPDPSVVLQPGVYQSSAFVSPSHGANGNHDMNPYNFLYDQQLSFSTSILGSSSQDPIQAYMNAVNPEPHPNYINTQGTSAPPMSINHPQNAEHNGPDSVWQATNSAALAAFSGMDDVMDFAFMHGFLSSPEDVRLLGVDPGASNGFSNFDHSSLSSDQFTPVGFQPDLNDGNSLDGSLTQWNRLMTEV